MYDVVVYVIDFYSIDIFKKGNFKAFFIDNFKSVFLWCNVFTKFIALNIFYYTILTFFFEFRIL